MQVALADPSGAGSCAFQVTRTVDGAATPVWYQRVNGPMPPMNVRLGAHHRGGFQPDVLAGNDPVRASIRRVRDTGIAGPIRLVMAPQQRGNVTANVYDVDFSACSESAPLLPCLAALPRFQNAFDEVGYGPDVPPIVLTTWDSTSGGATGDDPDCPGTEGHCFLDEAWMTANYAAVRAEYAALAGVLYQTQGGKGGRTFVLINWEGDNSIYCGSSYLFAKGALACPASPDGASVSSRFAAFTSWFHARQDGMADARAQYAAKFPDVQVEDGIELNSFSALTDAGYPSVLHDIIPVLRPVYASYSAWESLGAGRFEQDLDALGANLAQLGIIGIVGEFGQSGVDGPKVSPVGPPTSFPWLFGEIVRAALRSPVQLLTIWEPYSSADLTDSVLSGEGVELDSMRLLRAAAAPPAYVPSASFAIGGVTEVAPVGGRRQYVLEGAFPSGAVPHVRCDSDDELGAVAASQAESALQVSVADPYPGSNRYCVFYVSAGGDPSTRGDDYGPVLSCPANGVPWVPCAKYP